MRAGASYEGAVRRAILALKFRGLRRVAEPLGDLLADLCVQEHIPVDVVIPVPLHAARKRQRGYNQAELLARRCGSRLARPVRSDLLTRVRDTPPQTKLPATERRRNVMNAFTLAQAAHAELSGKQVLLVDDVATTGSTLDAAAAVAAQTHPALIWGIVVARPDERKR
jgi:ComF family protein